MAPLFLWQASWWGPIRVWPELQRRSIWYFCCVESIFLPTHIPLAALLLPENVLVSRGGIYHLSLVILEGLKMTRKKLGHLFHLMTSKDVVLDSAVLCICFGDTFFHSARRCGASVPYLCSSKYCFLSSGLWLQSPVLCLEEVLLWPVSTESLLCFLRRACRFPAVWRCPPPCCDSQDLLEGAAGAPPHFWPLQPCCQLPEWVVTSVLLPECCTGQGQRHLGGGVGGCSPTWDTMWLQTGLSSGWVGAEGSSWTCLSCLPWFLGVEEVNRVEVVRKTLQTLPEENYQVLHVLTAFLVQVSCSKGGQSYSSSIAGALHQLFDCLLPLFLWEDMSLELGNSLSVPYVLVKQRSRTITMN